MTFEEALNSSSEREEATCIPNPPSLAGSASNFRMESLGGGWPVMDGKKSERIVSSRLSRWLLILGTVPEMYDHLLAMLCVNAAKATWGCDIAKFERSFSSLVH